MPSTEVREEEQAGPSIETGRERFNTFYISHENPGSQAAPMLNSEFREFCGKTAVDRCLWLSSDWDSTYFVVDSARFCNSFGGYDVRKSGPSEKSEPCTNSQDCRTMHWCEVERRVCLPFGSLGTFPLAGMLKVGTITAKTLVWDKLGDFLIKLDSKKHYRTLLLGNKGLLSERPIRIIRFNDSDIVKGLNERRGFDVFTSVVSTDMWPKEDMLVVRSYHFTASLQHHYGAARSASDYLKDAALQVFEGIVDQETWKKLADYTRNNEASSPKCTTKALKAVLEATKPEYKGAKDGRQDNNCDPQTACSKAKMRCDLFTSSCRYLENGGVFFAFRSADRLPPRLGAVGMFAIFPRHFLNLPLALATVLHPPHNNPFDKQQPEFG